MNVGDSFFQTKFYVSSALSILMLHRSSIHGKYYEAWKNIMLGLSELEQRLNKSSAKAIHSISFSKVKEAFHLQLAPGHQKPSRRL